MVTEMWQKHRAPNLTIPSWGSTHGGWRKTSSTPRGPNWDVTHLEVPAVLTPCPYSTEELTRGRKHEGPPHWGAEGVCVLMNKRGGDLMASFGSPGQLRWWPPQLQASVILFL